MSPDVRQHLIPQEWVQAAVTDMRQLVVDGRVTLVKTTAGS